MNYNLINTDYLETVSGGEKEVIIELVGIFREQVTEIAAEMKSLYEKHEYHALGLLAHKAKSSVAIMGINDLAMMLKTFEIEGKEGKNNENFKSYIERYEKEAGMAVEELENYIKNI